MRKVLQGLTFLLGFSFIAANANATLIVNGSFEEGVINGGWASVNSTFVTGWESNKSMEIWRTYGLTSYDGEQHVELNAAGSGTWSIWQTIFTEADTWYQISFAAAKRSGTSNNVFTLSVFDGSLVSLLNETISLTQTNWNIFSYRFKATDAMTTVKFTTVSPTSSAGNLLDNVSVVPEPGALGLLGLAMVGLYSRKRKVLRVK